MILAGYLFNGKFYKSLQDLRGKTMSDDIQPVPLYINKDKAEGLHFYDRYAIKNELKASLKLLRDLADLQNGPPLVREEEEWNETITSVYDFLEQHEK